MQQRMMLVGIFAISLLLLGFVIFVFNEPTYTTLYSNLAGEDASKVIEQLTSQKVQYKIEDSGTTIKVPKDKVYEIRFSMASKGIPNSGIVGYEIFDKNTMGMSEFMQKLNYKRALEGEISRTIMQQSGIEGARVHIVFPEKSIFKEDKKEPTASVVLKMNTGIQVSQNNIIAISNLVASSVEGLKPGKVTVLDTQGRLLSREEDENSFTAASGKQYEIKSSVETYLAQKAQSLLDNVLGYGNSVVRVNVDLNFKQVDKTMESFDPNSQVAVSEQSVKSESAGLSMSDSNAVTSENTTTNYEISKTIERVIDGAGNIQRVTIAAVINGVSKQVKNGDVTETVIEPRSPEQLQKLEQIVRQAVGIDDSRQDQVSLVSIPFETNFVEELPKLEESPMDNIQDWSNFILIFFAIGASFFVLKGLMNRLKNEKIMIGNVNYSDNAFNDLMPSIPSGSFGSQSMQMTPSALPKKKPILQIGDLEDEITDEALRKKTQHDKIINYVQKKPSEAAKLINSWLREDEF
ncbi:MAG: flagellar M-ring protein FliF [Bacteroidetes bacterium]|nr:flagellar M-ring protein FliF [Bacteroidota bacterium]